MGTRIYAANDTKKQMYNLGKFGALAYDLVGRSEEEIAGTLFAELEDREYTVEECRIMAAHLSVMGVESVYADWQDAFWDNCMDYVVIGSRYGLDPEVGLTPRQYLDPVRTTTCWCHRCGATTFFVVCPDCGNKRCPKASDHDLACTNSNEPGQKGSVYE